MDLVVDNVLRVLPQFALVCVALAVLPGPGMALFLHRTVRDGRRPGLASVLGNEIGIFGWALAAGAGLTTLLQANHVLFEAMHVVGAVVLVYLGVSAWRSARRADAEGFGGALTARLPSGHTPLGALRTSLLSIAANPKVAAFAFSFFPQFLPAHGPVFVTTVALAAIQVVIDGAVCVAIVLLAERAGAWLSRPVVRRRMERVLGTVLLVLGVELAAEAR